MDRDMGTNDDMYGSYEVRSLSSSGCSNTDRISGSADGLISINRDYNKHISTISDNILNTNQNSLSSLGVDYISYFYSVFPLHPNTFHQLFKHSTQPQLDKLESLISEFHNFNLFVVGSEISLYADIVYLGGIAYVIFLHLAYLLTSILQFNALEIYYTFSVLTSLVGFMAEIKLILIETSTYLQDLMNILIKEFCAMINYIFEIIKAKLLYFINRLELQIDLDTFVLSIEVASFELMLSKLQSDLGKYILILETVEGLLNKLITLLSHIKILKTGVSIIESFNKIITKLLCKFKSICPSSDKINGIVCCLQQEQSNESTNGNNTLKKLILTIPKTIGCSVSEIILKFDPSLITKFNKYKNFISKLSITIELADLVLSTEMMPIVGQLDVLEIINLVKLNFLVNQIELKYFDILIREYLLICTIEFYNDVTRNVSELFGSLKFECSKVCGFLGKCSEVEEYITKVSTSITKCIKNLAKGYKTYEACGVRPGLLKLYLNIIIRILELKFYVDLMMLEILIFKTIILTLVQMSVSSAILDGLTEVIGKIKDVDSAIETLIFVSEYLKTFYLIQLENTLLIFALSSKIMFSESIHQEYRVLFLNLDLISRLIWVIECYINHLLVFRQVTKGLNGIYPHVLTELKIVVSIIDVISEINNIMDKLNLIKSSITKLNTIQSSMNILNWKESAQGIRHETKSINTNVNHIDSEIKKIIGHLASIFKSWDTLVSLYYVLLVLILQVMVFIKITDNRYNMGLGIRNRYYRGLIVSVMEPCNKQLMYIFWYLLLMLGVMENLIKIVQNSIVMIYFKMGWLYALNKILQKRINEIDKGVVAVECAIEGVVLNFIKCTIKSLTDKIISNNTSTDIRDEEVDNQVVDVYSVVSVNQYKDLVNRMLEFWTFCDESVYAYGYILLCRCTRDFKSKYRYEAPSSFDYGLPSIKTRDINPVSELVRQTMAENVGNHLCLCLVIKYHLRPTLLKCILFLRNEELGTLDTISRKFDNYNSFVGVNDDLWKMCGLILNIIYELTSLLRNRYNFVWIRSSYPAEIKCFCTNTNTIDYHYIICISLYLSSLIENIWSMDSESLRMAIECLSTLYSQLEIYDLSSFKDTKKLSCNSIYTLLLNKQCHEKDKCVCKNGDQKCCCWCVTCFNLLVICVSLCLQCKLCKAICNESKKPCDNVKDYFKEMECKCECLKEPKDGLCCLLKLALSAVGGCKDLEKKLQECCTKCTGENGWCKQILENVKSGLCKLLLLGCCCNDGKFECGEGSDGQLKGWCLIFKNPYSDKSMAVVVFCKCGEQAKGCCLTQLVDKLKEPLQKLFQNGCQGKDCCCKELQNVCKDLCCGTNCGEGCVCKNLKDNCKAICGSDSKCLCQEIKILKDCCFDGKRCKCYKDKEGCCRCACCKLVGMSIKILLRACTENVLEPYKRIVLELLRCSKDKKELLRQITKSINVTTLNNIYLVKNNLISSTSYPYSIGSYAATINGVTNVETRNWGYDTKYEHDVTNDKGFSKGDQYPYVSNSYGTGIHNMSGFMGL